MITSFLNMRLIIEIGFDNQITNNLFKCLITTLTNIHKLFLAYPILFSFYWFFCI